MNARRPTRLRYFLFHKPYGVLSQFTAEGGRPTLAQFGPFPHDVYPAGRLDADSEGLLLLTNDGRLKHFLMEPRYEHPRTYLVQVERVPDGRGLERLRRGVKIGGVRTRPADVALLERDPDVPPRTVPIRFRKSVPTAWLQLTLYEGRNRQVRRMTAAIGYPALRLIRVSIGHLSIEGLAPGEWRELREEETEELGRVRSDNKKRAAVDRPRSSA